MQGRVVRARTGVYVVKDAPKRVPLTDAFVAKITSGKETPKAFKEAVKEIAKREKK